jgi:hypothetical protein
MQGVRAKIQLMGIKKPDIIDWLKLLKYRI